MGDVGKYSFSFGCFSWPTTILSIAIIAIRAFQQNAEPMSSWSVFSWCLMLLPTMLPFVIWLIVIVLSLISVVITAIFPRW